MKRARIAIIAPRIPPLLCGIGDYSWKLGEALGDDFERFFLLTDSRNSAHPDKDGIECQVIAPTQTSKITQLLDSHADVVLLQYGQYDYHEKGHPSALVDALLKWRETKTNRLLISMVHELWIPSLPRRRELFHFPLQYWVHRRLFRASDTVFVNNRRSWNKVQVLRGRAPEKLLPVFSNFGEPHWDEQQWQGRPGNSWVIFGSVGRILRSLRSFIHLLDSQSHLKVDQLTVLGGEESSEIRDILNRLQVKSAYHPNQPITAFHSQLMQSQIGFIDYDEELESEPSLILKSGVFASMLAYGLLPAVPDSAREALKSQAFHSLDYSKPMNVAEMFNSVNENCCSYHAKSSLRQCAQSYMDYISE